MCHVRGEREKLGMAAVKAGTQSKVRPFFDVQFVTYVLFSCAFSFSSPKS